MIRHMLNHNGARWLPSETRPRRAASIQMGRLPVRLPVSVRSGAGFLPTICRWR